MNFIEFISTYWLLLIPTCVFCMIMYFTGIDLQKEYDLYNWWFCMIWLSLTMALVILVFYVNS